MRLGVEKFDEILEASDGIMVARGDLGIEIAPELVPHIQKEIIAKCNAAYKPVITATQMLDSMQHNPRPTRAEVTDVANAILDGTDAVMLSGETAAGQYPVEAVAMQARIAIETEKYMPAHAELAMPENASGTRVVNNVVGMSAVQMATAVGAKCITVPTTTGRTARLISHFRPNMPICAFSRHEWAVQQMIMYWGVIPRQAGDHPGHRQRHHREGCRDGQGARLRREGRSHRRDRRRCPSLRRARGQGLLDQPRLRGSGSLRLALHASFQAISSLQRGSLVCPASPFFVTGHAESPPPATPRLCRRPRRASRPRSTSRPCHPARRSHESGDFVTSFKTSRVEAKSKEFYLGKRCRKTPVYSRHLETRYKIARFAAFNPLRPLSR